MASDAPLPAGPVLAALAELLAGCSIPQPTTVGVIACPECERERSAAAARRPDHSPETPKLTLVLNRLPDVDLLDALAGFRAPLPWGAFGVVAPARAHRLDPPPGSSRAPEPVQAAVLVDRHGRVADAIVDRQGRPLTSGPPRGRLVDVCRRVLGLATNPPPCEPSVWATLAGLDALLADALSSGPTGTGHRPVAERLGPPPERTPPWPVLRRECAAGSREVPGVNPTGADWMDDGMFAREALGALVPLEDAVDDLRDLLAPIEFEALLRELLRRFDGCR